MTSSYVEETNWRPDTPTPLAYCPLADVMEIIGGKWRAPTLWWLGQKPRHFGELRRQMPEVSPKVLTEQLKALEEACLVERTEELDGRVLKVRYGLTPAGAELLPILDQLCTWGATQHDRVDELI
jgi:DNA-binding HxlR family transcriptional regulator